MSQEHCIPLAEKSFRFHPAHPPQSHPPSHAAAPIPPVILPSAALSRGGHESARVHRGWTSELDIVKEWTRSKKISYFFRKGVFSNSRSLIERGFRWHLSERAVTSSLNQAPFLILPGFPFASLAFGQFVLPTSAGKATANWLQDWTAGSGTEGPSTQLPQTGDVVVIPPTTAGESNLFARLIVRDR